MPTLTRNRKPSAPQTAQPVGPGPGRPSGVRGGVQGVNLIILILVAASVVIAAGLLAKTVNTARSIDEKAKSISSTGGTINESTDAIAQLVETNRIARSILKTASPLDGVLTKIEARAKSINSDASSIDGLASSILSTAGTVNTTATSIGGSASSINSVAGEINNTAGSIDSVAGGINSSASTISRLAVSIRGTAGSIVGIAKIIDTDAKNIVDNATTTVALAKAIKVDSGNILVISDRILDTAGCIDRKLPGPNKPANSCQGKP